MKMIETLIVGAGPTGIGAAWACENQGLKYLLVEAAANAGGLASTISHDGYRWDLGGHVIHSHFPDFDTAIRQSGVRMLNVQKTGTVLVGGNQFVPTPVQQQLDRIPSDIRPGSPADNLAQYYLNEMGQELYESFFYPLSIKMWAHPPEEMDHAWTSLRSGSRNPTVPRVGLRTSPGTAEAFPYPEAGSGSIWEGLAARLDPGAQRYGVRLTALDLQGQIARFDGVPDVRYGRLISTIPLDRLCGIASDEPGRQLGRELAHTKVALFGFGFRGPIPESLAGKTYIYCASEAVYWYRATILSNYSAAMAPVGCWNILFECGSSVPTPMAEMEAAADSCLHSLAGLGVNLEQLDRRWSRFLAYGYPVPMLGRDATLREILSAFEARNVWSRGRFGGWRYESCNQDYSFAQGVEAIVSGKDDVLWRPENFDHC